MKEEQDVCWEIVVELEKIFSLEFLELILINNKDEEQGIGWEKSKQLEMTLRLESVPLELIWRMELIEDSEYWEVELNVRLESLSVELIFHMDMEEEQWICWEMGMELEVRFWLE